MATRRTESGVDWAPWILGLAIVIAWLALLLSRLDYLVWHDDEGVFVLTARAVAHGQALYRDVWYNYPPGFVTYLVGAFRVGGATLTTARLAAIVAGLGGLLAVSALAGRLGGRWAGFAALVLLATAPHFGVVSNAVLAEAPAYALASLAALGAVSFIHTRRLQALAISGVASALAIMVKPTSAPVLTAGVVAVLVTPPGRHSRVLALALYVASLLAGIAACLSAYAWRTWLAQMLVPLSHSREAFVWDWQENAEQIWRYLVDDKYGLRHCALLVLPVVAVASGDRESRLATLPVVLWLAGMVLTSALYTPLYRHHLVGMLFPLAALGGNGLASAVRAMVRSRHPVVVALCGAITVLALTEIVASARASVLAVKAVEADGLEETQQAIDWVRENTPGGSVLITDAPIIALRAGRDIPNEVINASRMRILTGSLNAETLIDVTQKQRPGAVIFWERKLQSVGDYSDWVGCHYRSAKEWDDRHRIFVPEPQPIASSFEVTDVAFAHGRLVGYKASDARISIGEGLAVTLLWEATTTAPQDYTVFVHLLDRDGARISQHDGVPKGGTCPTSKWEAGQLYVDVHPIEIARLGAGGPYRIMVGWYTPETGQRLEPYDTVIATLP